MGVFEDSVQLLKQKADALAEVWANKGDDERKNYKMEAYADGWNPLADANSTLSAAMRRIFKTWFPNEQKSKAGEH